MINGGSKTNEIVENTFNNLVESGSRGGNLESFVSLFAESLSKYMRPGYFELESAPMIHLYTPKFYDYLSPNISIRDP
jgi:hypothetical protein